VTTVLLPFSVTVTVLVTELTLTVVIPYSPR
jgi:hypothetical protein